MTSASVHLLLKGAVPMGVSPGEQPVFNQNVFNNKQNDIIKSAVDFGLVEKQKLLTTILHQSINSIQVFISTCNNTYLPLDFLPKWMI